MKEIPLSNTDKFALVDDEDHELALKYNWHLQNHGYARTFVKRKTILLHRLVMGASPDQRFDHRNLNKLDCQKGNLRLCTQSQNTANGKVRSNNKLGVKGVDWYPNYKKFRASLTFNYKKVFIGYYSTLLEAARAYNESAKKYFGEFALLNDLEAIYDREG